MAKYFNSVTGTWEDDGKPFEVPAMPFLSGYDDEQQKLKMKDKNDLVADMQTNPQNYPFLNYDIFGKNEQEGKYVPQGFPDLSNLMSNIPKDGFIQPTTNELGKALPKTEVKPITPFKQSISPKMPSSVPGKPPEAETKQEFSPLDQLLKNLADKPQDDKELAEAMKTRQDVLNQNSLLRAINNIGRAMAYQTPDEGFLSDVDKNIQNVVSNVLTRRKESREQQEEARKKVSFALDTEKGKVDLDKAKVQLDDLKALENPNSDVSKAYRETIRNRFELIGKKINIPDTLPAVTLSKLYPTTDLVDDFIKLQGMKEAAALRREGKLDDVKDKLTKQMGEALDLSKYSSRTPLGAQKGVLDDADRALALYDQFKGGNMPAAQTEEFALATARLITGGKGGMSRGQIEALVPKSARGDIKKMVSWLTNNPTGQDQQAFTNLMHETALREKQIAENKISEMQSKMLPRFEKLKQISPDTYSNILEKNVIQKSAPKQQNIDPKIDSFAKQYNIGYDQAKAVLVKRGYTPNE